MKETPPAYMKHGYIIDLVIKLRKLYVNMELSPGNRKISIYDHPCSEEILFQWNKIYVYFSSQRW